MTSDVEKWLLDGPSWIKYAVGKQLLNMSVSSQEPLNSTSIGTIIKYLIEDDEGIDSILKGTASYTKKDSGFYIFFQILVLLHRSYL